MRTKECQSLESTAITGAIDIVASADTCYAIYNGNPAMSRITGTGCQLSALITAFVCAATADIKREEKSYIDNAKLEATVAAVCTMGLAGEMAFDRLSKEEGNSTYRNKIIDAIYNMTGDMLDKGAKYECY